MKAPKIAGLIPARLESSRLPQKAIADIHGLPMIVHVFRRCCLAKSLHDVFVATDSEQIKEVVESFGGRVIMTGRHHETGTDRIAEAAEQLSHDIVVNIQGDEALVDPNHIDAVIQALLDDPALQVAILVNPFKKRNSPSDIKVVLNRAGDVMYFSRADIPSNSRVADAPLLKAYHIVPFRRDFLFRFSRWEKGDLERVEFNEYLRILEMGERIRAVKVESSAISVDTLEDLEFVRDKMSCDPFLHRYCTRQASL